MLFRAFLALLALSLVAHASLSSKQYNSDLSKHSLLARRASSNDNHAPLKKRCKPREKSTLLSTQTPAKPKAVSTKPAPVKTTSSKPVSTSVHHSSSSSAVKPSSSPPPKPASSQPANNDPVTSIVSGLLQVTSPICGPSGATKEITASSGPNGQEEFLNCGINGAGWQPPNVAISQLIVVDLNEAIKDPNTPFKPCTPYVSLFNKYGGMFNIPPILLASIAMQESTCNPSAVGAGGEQGMMQISKDKCVNAPGGNCQDTDFNVKEGASFFSETLKDNGGSVLLTIGQYNGWTPHMTIAQATAAAHSSCCRCQNNLDYLFQVTNGWAQNKNPSGGALGTYQNLANCP